MEKPTASSQSENQSQCEPSTSKKANLPIEKKYSITQEASKELRAKYGKIFIPSDKNLRLKSKDSESKTNPNSLLASRLLSPKTRYISPKEVKAAKESFVENMRDLIQCRSKLSPKCNEQQQDEYNCDDDSAKGSCTDPSCHNYVVENVDPFTYHIKFATDNQPEEIAQTSEIDLTVEIEETNLTNEDKDENVNDSSTDKTENKRKRRSKTNAPVQRRKLHHQTEATICDPNVPSELTMNHRQMLPFPPQPPNFPHNNFDHSSHFHPPPYRRPVPASNCCIGPSANRNFNYFDYRDGYPFQPGLPYPERVRNHFDYNFHPHFGRNIHFPPRWPPICGFETMDFRHSYPQRGVRYPPSWFSDPSLLVRDYFHPPYPPFPVRRYFEL